MSHKQHNEETNQPLTKEGAEFAEKYAKLPREGQIRVRWLIERFTRENRRKGLIS